MIVVYIEGTDACVNITGSEEVKIVRREVEQGGTATLFEGADLWLWGMGTALTEIIESIDFSVTLANAPVWGWWNDYRPHFAPCHFVDRPTAQRIVRPQARACHVDRNRWKRRRYVHALRRKAAA